MWLSEFKRKQKTIFKRIETHYIDIISVRHVEALRILIMGTGNHNYLKSELIVIASIGVRYSTSTWDNSFSPFDTDNEQQKAWIRQHLFEATSRKLQDVQYFIIDEKSMVGRRMLGLIDTRLFRKNKNEPFGGRLIILFGDQCLMFLYM